MDVDVDEDVAMDMAIKWVEHLKWHKAIRGHLVPVSELLGIASAPELILPPVWLVASWPKFFPDFFIARQMVLHACNFPAHMHI